MSTEQIRLVVVELSTLNMSSEPQPCDWVCCCLCGGTILSPQSEGCKVFDDDDCYCETCGAVDSWVITDYGDGEAHASLGLDPEDSDEVRVVREVWDVPDAKRVWWGRFETDDVDWVIVS